MIFNQVDEPQTGSDDTTSDEPATPESKPADEEEAAAA